MSAQQLIVCKFCNRSNFKSTRGLKQHLNTNKLCVSLAADAECLVQANNDRNARYERLVDQEDDLVAPFQQCMAVDEDSVGGDEDFGLPDDDSEEDADDGFQWVHNLVANQGPNHGQDEAMAGQEPSDYESEEEDNDGNPCPIARDRFKEYVAWAQQNFMPLPQDYCNAIKLMHTLVRKKATLDTYDEVMEWHFRATGEILPHESLADTKSFLCRKKLMKYLAKRYHINPAFYFEKPIVLPVSRTKVQLIWHRARDCIASLLTDPRFLDDNFLFFDNDPFAPPPAELTHVSDINTGLSYLETYDALITKPNQILVPIVLYLDGAVAGQFQKLKIEALRISLGIFTRTTRDKEHAWRTLGYVPNYTKESSRSKKILLESGHDAGAQLETEEGEGEQDEGGRKSHEAQDWHEILDQLLDSYAQVETKGMLWDLAYRGKVHVNCELVFFIPFLKVDNEEADAICGRYRSRGQGVKQLCRYCECPAKDTDKIDANYPLKTAQKIKGLVDNSRLEALKNLSQLNIHNAFHKRRFGSQNKTGVHGACPVELLHSLLLGIFLYVRNCFFAQIGPTSASAEEINSLAKLYGLLFTRQSDRDLPKTNFAKGIQKGKLMAKEFSGVMLNMAAILQSSDGRALLAGARSKNFSEECLLDDWALLVETLLEWEAFLKLDKMEVYHVHRLKKKNRVIMYLLKKVARRTAGMGMKFMKFHSIMHLSLDILNFGVPMNTDTGSNETHHKLTKIAAKLTQKDIRFFEAQTAQRIMEFLILDFAMEELEGRTMWDYFVNCDYPDANGEWPADDNAVPMDDDDVQMEEEPVKEAPTSTGGTRIKVSLDDDTNEVAWAFCGNKLKNAGKVAWDVDVQEFLLDLQQRVSPWIEQLDVCTEHKRNGEIFRAHPGYRGETKWNDWVLVDWGADGHSPGEIWAFVDLRDLPVGVQVPLGNYVVQNGVYAVIESADIITQDDAHLLGEYAAELGKSDLFTPIIKECSEIEADGSIAKRQLYLADVEAFLEPICVVPDVGSDVKRKYFQVLPRKLWAEQFTLWLNQAHKFDDINDFDDEDGDDEANDEPPENYLHEDDN